VANTDQAVAVENLSLDFDGHPALAGIDLSIAPGSVVGLVGRNGAGKSSLLRCLVGLTAPTRGCSGLLGRPSLDLDDSTRERLGYVAQTPDLFGWMDIWEHIETIGKTYARWDSERALRLALLLELPLGGKVAKLSLGDQQKLAMVMALAHDPDLLLFDEPVSSLDPVTRRDFMRALFAERDDRTIMLSSHLLHDLERIVTHVAFLRRGRLQLFDSWDALIENLRIVDLESDDEAPGGVLHRVERPEGARVIVDRRRAPGDASRGRPLGLDELFVEINT
jgi:ABC-2 type transport system ATP-binding protein